jgi:hypothetical protein
MNKTVLSEIEKAKNAYPLVLKEIHALYDNYYCQRSSLLKPNVDSEGRLFSNSLNKIISKLNEITGKDIVVIASYNEWYALELQEDYENLSFKISLPEPKIIEDITQAELKEIYEIVKSEDYKKYAHTHIEYKFFNQFNDYFQGLLEINLQYLLNNCDEK